MPDQTNRFDMTAANDGAEPALLDVNNLTIEQCDALLAEIANNVGMLPSLSDLAGAVMVDTFNLPRPAEGVTLTPLHRVVHTALMSGASAIVSGLVQMLGSADEDAIDLSPLLVKWQAECRRDALAGADERRKMAAALIVAANLGANNAH